MTTFANKIISFNQNLEYKGNLPDGISIMNPFKENPNILPISTEFYKKYYSDNST